MIGISKKNLEDMLRAEGRLDIKIALNYLIQQCTELNPWLPIDENTPKDKPLVFYYPDIDDVAVVTWNKEHKFYVSTKAGKPTLYQELPDDPKVQ